LVPKRGARRDSRRSVRPVTVRVHLIGSGEILIIAAINVGLGIRLRQASETFYIQIVAVWWIVRGSTGK
jgi:hypothetical protein